MFGGKGTKIILSILIIFIFICAICYLVYEKKGMDLLFNDDTYNYMIPNLFKEQLEENQQVNHQNTSEYVEQDIIDIDSIIEDGNEEVESFIDNQKIKNAEPIIKKDYLNTRDKFLSKQNILYSNCSDEFLNKELIHPHKTLYNL